MADFDLISLVGLRNNIFGDRHIAGQPCGFSPMGAGRREEGASMLCLYVWARALREQALMLVIIEKGS